MLKKRNTKSVEAPVVVAGLVGDEGLHEVEKPVPWGPFRVVLYALFIYFAAQFAAATLVGIIPMLNGWSSQRVSEWIANSVVAQFWYVLVAEALMFAAVYWFVRTYKVSLRRLGLNKPRLMHVVHMLAAFALYFISYVILLSIVTHLFPSINVTQKQELGFDNASRSHLDLVLAFVSLVLLPPIVEETVFRGMVFQGILTKYKPVVATVLTSVLFATAHLQFGSGNPLLWTAAIDTFTLSMVLCLLRYKTGSLWPGIYLHMTKNCIAFLALYVFVH